MQSQSWPPSCHTYFRNRCNFDHAFEAKNYLRVIASVTIFFCETRLVVVTVPAIQTLRANFFSSSAFEIWIMVGRP